MRKEIIDYLKENYIYANPSLTTGPYTIRKVTRRCNNGKIKIEGMKGYYEIGIQDEGKSYEWEIRELNDKEIVDAYRMASLEVLREAMKWVVNLDENAISTIAKELKRNLLTEYNEEDRQRCNWVQSTIIALNWCENIE